MADIINLLPDHVANQIAAGEVVQRPASVIKELIENSIDAGATKVQVVVKDGGKTLIQVIDNGCGMSATDARMCFERHATSKIQSAADLFDIQTMGFRGEAMASIVAIATVEMRTRKYGDEVGTYIKISGSEVEEQEPVSCPNGTNIMVKNLFYNVPARRKFLKSDGVEMGHITEEFCRVALAFPEVEMSLEHNGIVMFNLSVSNLLNRIIGIGGKSLSKNLLPINSNTSVVRLHGYVGTPESAKSKSDQYFFVNNRYMRHPYFYKAVVKAYDQLLPAGKTPMFFIYMDVDPTTIDINIHPTKTEIKFENEATIWPILESTVKEPLGKFSVGSTLNFDAENRFEFPTFSKDAEVVQPEIHYIQGYNPFGSAGGTGGSHTATFRSKMSGKTDANWQKLYGGLENYQPQIHGDNQQAAAVEQQPADAQPVEATQMQIGNIGAAAGDSCGKFFQLKGKYILTNVKSGLMVIDQRRAHERILYDEMLQHAGGEHGSQSLLYPERIDLSAKDAELFLQMLPELEQLGFVISRLGGNSFSVAAIPSIFKEKDIREWINSMLMLTGENYISIKESMRETIASSMARYMAIGYGQPLSVREMADINNRLFACQMPNYTPSGKPIVTIIATEDIDKLFK